MRRFAMFSGVVVVLNIALLLALANPKWAHGYQAGTDRLVIHATEPLPKETAAFADQVMALLDASPLPPKQSQFHVYITGDGWRDRFFFFAAPSAGGVTYPVASKVNAFLSGAQIPEDRLLKHGSVVVPPRTLTYYAVHEVAHMIHVQKIGFLNYVRLPHWVREGVPDYVALGPVGADEMDQIAGFAPSEDRFPLMSAHGSYPEYRVAVTRFLETGSFDDLVWGRLGQ